MAKRKRKNFDEILMALLVGSELATANKVKNLNKFLGFYLV